MYKSSGIINSVVKCLFDKLCLDILLSWQKKKKVEEGKKGGRKEVRKKRMLLGRIYMWKVNLLEKHIEEYLYDVQITMDFLHKAHSTKTKSDTLFCIKILSTVHQKTWYKSENISHK